MRTTGTLVATLALAACAAQSPSDPSLAGRDCFNANTARGFEMIDQNNIRVRVGANRHYILTTTWNARDLDWTQTIGLRSTSGWVCTGPGLGVDVIGGRPRRTFPISSITRQPDEPAVEGN